MSEPKLLVTKINRDGGRSEVEILLTPCTLFGLDANSTAQFQKDHGLDTSATVALSMNTAPMQTVEINDNCFLSMLNRAAGGRTVILITNSAATAKTVGVLLWKWVGQYQPSANAFVLAAGASALIELYCFGSNSSQIVARWSPVSPTVV